MANKISGSDAVLKVIEAWGVDHIFGYPVVRLIQQ